jgi:cytochrome b pre-mRNA-processing protein 3
MILSLKRRRPGEDIPARLYQLLVAQARHPALYTGYGVPDSVTGRFEMVVLHTVLLMHRLKGRPEPAGALSQDLLDAFAQSMDHGMREAGVGDLSVPKKMQRITEAFYGRLRAYDAALAQAGGEPLHQVLARNVFPDAPASTPDAQRLAAYMRAAAERLAATPDDAIFAGRLDLPDPEVIHAG